MTLFEELQWRGLIKDTAGVDLADKLNGEPITFYWGTDPTADSLHIGHYSTFLVAKRLQKAGHNPILLVGGATGLVGDPRGTGEREKADAKVIQSNFEKLKAQVERLFGIKCVNNYDWFKGYELTDFLRDVGKYININYMLDKDIIRKRLETGITFAEFTYTLIQGYDFLWLYENKGCILQAEGSDQWGNITTGLDLIKKKTGKDAYAFTMPLVLDKYGNKFGKSEGNALWLDRNKTSSYELYQYLINVDDEMVISYLKIFTFLTPEEIMQLEKSNQENPHLREAHKALAREIITDLHGKDAYLEAVKISESLFSGNIKELSAREIEDAFKGIEPFVAKEENLVDFLVEFGICSSKREAREFISNGSISVNGDRVTDLDYLVTKDIAIEQKYVVVRRGKKKYFIGKF